MTMRLISVLRMKDTTLAEWQRLSRIGQHIGDIGKDTAGLWDWTLTYRGLSTQSGCVLSQDSLAEYAGGAYGRGNRVQAGMVIGALTSIERRLRWPVEKTQQS
jgi:hypothetical protein